MHVIKNWIAPQLAFSHAGKFLNYVLNLDVRRLRKDKEVGKSAAPFLSFSGVFPDMYCLEGPKTADLPRGDVLTSLEE